MYLGQEIGGGVSGVADAAAGVAVIRPSWSMCGVRRGEQCDTWSSKGLGSVATGVWHSSSVLGLPGDLENILLRQVSLLRGDS